MLHTGLRVGAAETDLVSGPIPESPREIVAGVYASLAISCGGSVSCG